MNRDKNNEEPKKVKLEGKEKLNYGTYDIIEEIGSGGGGIVYKAYHKNLKKYVVVKQIKSTAKGILNSRAEVDILKNLNTILMGNLWTKSWSEKGESRRRRYLNGLYNLRTP